MESLPGRYGSSLKAYVEIRPPVDQLSSIEDIVSDYWPDSPIQSDVFSSSSSSSSM
jgi:hypothetical protein